MGKEIGIDLGTTNTVVSYVNKKGKLVQLKYRGEAVIPSVVYYDSKNDFCIGKVAYRKMLANPEGGVKEFKINIGNTDKLELVAENGDKFKHRYKNVTKEFLGRLREAIEAQLFKEFPEDGGIGDVVITVPAKFNEAQKGLIKWAALEVGFEKVKLLPEPTAAAVAYQRDSGENGQYVLVYDFGGGTFDVSIIHNNKGKYTEITTDGKKELGGRDIDKIVVQYLLKCLEDDYGFEMPLDELSFDEECGITLKDYKLNLMGIQEEAIRIKEELSEEEDVEFLINLVIPDEGSVALEGSLSRAQFNKLIKKKIEETITITKNTIQDAKNNYGIDNIDEIVLAGGSSHIPMVADMLEELFGKEKMVFADNVSTLISRGAAILANEELNTPTVVKSNVQYGVVATEGVNIRQFKPIIMENKELPCSGSHVFYLNRDGQRDLLVEYYERDIKNYPKARRCDDNGIEYIDALEITNLPKDLVASEAAVEVFFTLNTEGTLEIKVEIKDKKGNIIRNNSVVKKASGNLE